MLINKINTLQKENWGIPGLLLLAALPLQNLLGNFD